MLSSTFISDEPLASKSGIGTCAEIIWSDWNDMTPLPNDMTSTLWLRQWGCDHSLFHSRQWWSTFSGWFRRFLSRKETKPRGALKKHRDNHECFFDFLRPTNPKRKSNHTRSRWFFGPWEFKSSNSKTPPKVFPNRKISQKPKTSNTLSKSTESAWVFSICGASSTDKERLGGEPGSCGGKSEEMLLVLACFGDGLGLLNYNFAQRTPNLRQNTKATSNAGLHVFYSSDSSGGLHLPILRNLQSLLSPLKGPAGLAHRPAKFGVFTWPFATVSEGLQFAFLCFSTWFSCWAHGWFISNSIATYLPEIPSEKKKNSRRNPNSRIILIKT